MESALQQALQTVHDPIFERSLVDMGLVEVADEAVPRLRVGLTSPSPELRETLETRLREALDAAGFKAAEFEWVLRAPTREIRSEDPIPEVRNVILVMSGKGGVGKSTVSSNLALSLKRQGYRVGLLDADMYGPSVPTLFGIQGHPSSEDGKQVKPLERFGVKLMSIGFLLEDPHAAVIWRGPMLHGALQQFLSDIDWGGLDFLVLDLPPGTGDIALTLSQKLRVSGVLMVTTPQEVALQDVYKGVSMCRKLSLPMLGVVENMSYFVDSAGSRHAIFGEGGGQRVAEFAEAPLLAQVPLETRVREQGDAGTPIVQAAPEAASSQAFAELATSLVTRLSEAQAASGDEGGLDAPKRLRIVR